MKNAVRIIRPSSRETDQTLVDNLDAFDLHGLRVLFDDRPSDGDWPWTSGSVEARAGEMVTALCEKESDIVWCGRGGYGASDLLTHLSWRTLGENPEKTLVGFSDVSALHSALYTQLGWRGIHGAMPFTSYWEGETDLALLMRIALGQKVTHSFPINNDQDHPQDIEGWVFGGCLSVLTGLIGTPYFPESLEGAILLFEDTGESPPRIMRLINQWIQSGSLRGVRAIVLGYFDQLLGADHVEGESQTELRRLAREINRRAELPVFTTDRFGHRSDNAPFQIGAAAHIGDDRVLIDFNGAPTRGER